LREKGESYPGLDAFYEDAARGTLPQVSYIVGPQELSEHPPNRPVDGAWLQQQVVEAVVNSPKYKETVLIISYDGKTNLPFSSRKPDFTRLPRQQGPDQSGKSAVNAIL
jgi:phospholipase C